MGSGSMGLEGCHSCLLIQFESHSYLSSSSVPNLVLCSRSDVFYDKDVLFYLNEHHLFCNFALKSCSKFWGESCTSV